MSAFSTVAVPLMLFSSRSSGTLVDRVNRPIVAPPSREQSADALCRATGTAGRQITRSGSCEFDPRRPDRRLAQRGVPLYRPGPTTPQALPRSRRLLLLRALLTFRAPVR